MSSTFGVMMVTQNLGICWTRIEKNCTKIKSKNAHNPKNAQEFKEKLAHEVLPEEVYLSRPTLFAPFP
jgi:hypothetical protein